jgi:polyribonucleotide nucleotidyltransferase
MNEVIAEPRTTLSEFAPRFYTVQIPTDKIRDLIGPGGKVIRGIIEATGVKIDVDDNGRVNVSSNDQEAASKALQMISDITATAEVGKTYLGKVTRLADFGAFVEIIPGTDGLLHISEIAEHRVNDVRDELKEGDQVLVKVVAVEGNRIKLSRKAILKEQRAKMGGGEAPHEGDGVPVTFEGGHEAADEPNYNRADNRAPRRDGDRGRRGGHGGHGSGRGDRRGPRR